MKKLTRNEMKNVVGGNEPSANCTTKCTSSSGAKLNCIKAAWGDDCILPTQCPLTATCK